MKNYRYRVYKDLEVSGTDQEHADGQMEKALNGKLPLDLAAGVEFACLGEVETVKITEEERAWAKPFIENFENMILMSGQYRGENCTFLALKTERPDRGPDFVSIRPVAFMLTEEKLNHCADPEGGAPEDHGYTYEA